MNLSIRRRSFLGTIGAGLLACGLPERVRAERKPNVLLILTDDHGTLDAHCYGANDLYTPAMDRLAETGIRFTQAYAHTVCCPARAMLMTGRYPQRSGVNTWTQADAHLPGKGNNMFREERTLAEALKDAGYATGLFGKWHLGAHADHGPTEQGFDEFIGLRGGFIDNYNHYSLHGRGFHDLYEGTTEVFANGEYFPDMITNRAMQFIDKNKERPFFAYVAFNVPHYPEQADPQFDERYASLPEPRRSYAKMISTTDDRIGRLIAKIEELGLREDTIVIMMGDNGHSTENYQITVDDHTSGFPKGHNYGANGGGGYTGKFRGAKGSFLEGGIRVPTFISYPRKLPQGEVRDQAVTIADWFPTVLELCGVAQPDVKLDGQSLVRIISSSETPTHHTVMHWMWQNNWAVREGEWKLLSRQRGSKTEPQGLFLANLDDEFPEKKDYSDTHPEMVTRLLSIHDEWVIEVFPEGQQADV